MDDAMTVMPEGSGRAWGVRIWRGAAAGGAVRRTGARWVLAAGLLGVGLPPAALAASGGADAGRHVDRAHPAPHPAAHRPVHTTTARARVDLGVGGPARGFRLAVEGGDPWGRALLCLRSEGGAVSTEVVELDEHGHGEVLRRDWTGEHDLDAWFLTANKGAGGGAPSNTVSVPGAAPLGELIVQQGDILINEFLKDPKSVSDSSGEWVELWNSTTRTVNIEGWWLLDDGGDMHMLYNKAQGIYLQPGQYFVLGRKADPALNGGVTVNYVYSGFSLANGDDEIRLVSRGGVLVDEVLYDNGVFWPDEAGKSISLDPRRRTAGLNDDPAYWCHGQAPIAAGNPDLGSPGSKNPRCP